MASILKMCQWVKFCINKEIFEDKVKELVKLLKRVSMIDTIFPNSEIFDKASNFLDSIREFIYKTYGSML